MREDSLFLKGHVALLICHHVAAVGDVACLELYAGGGGLKGRPAGVVELGVAAENGHYRGVAAGRQAAGHVQNAAHLAPGGELVDKGLFRILQRGQPAELGNGIISHTVADYKYIFHVFTSFSFRHYKISDAI